MPPLSILVKPASSACNLRCSYCFYADEASIRSVPNYGRMPAQVSSALIEGAMGAAEGAVSFLFQGGEPTLAGLEFYRDFVSRVHKAAPPGLAVQYAIQTNGTLLDAEWCRFFREHRFLVGLSRDGAGKGTYDRVVRAARLLERAGVEYNVLTVVTGYLARHIRSVFAALCRDGFRFQQYIPCLDPLGEERGGQGYSLSPAQYGEFLNTLFDLWYCGLQYLVEADGSVYPCDFYGLDEFLLGNVLQNSWTELDRAREELGFIRDSQRVPEQCGRCRWYPLCRNGCRRDRLAGEDGLGRNYYCDAYAGFFSYALPRLRKAYALLGLR